jgi:hypothetical protein
MPLNEVEAIAHECANLLIVYYTYVETIKRFDPEGTRFDLLRRQIHIKVTENDLILRLCRLDDTDTVLVQPKMEKRRSPLVSIPPFRAGIFKA